MEITKSKINKAILATVSIVGILSVALVAPNAVQLLATFDKFSKKTRPSSIKRSFNILLQKGYLKITNGKVCLTDKGKSFIEKTDFRNYGKKEKWDKKWRMVIFDIPEKRKKVRYELRRTLNEVGFLRLQDSVWVYPYECSELISLIKADFKVGKDILYVIVDQIENDKPIKKCFGLG